MDEARYLGDPRNAHTSAPAPRRTISAAQGEQGELLSRLQNSISDLEKSIRPVLCASKLSETGAGPIDKEPSTVLNVLDIHNRILQQLISQLDDLGQRVEL